MRRRSLLLLACLVAAAAAAAPPPPAVMAEIEALLSRLEASGCSFNRNGAWHTAPQAKAHLLRKLKHLEVKIAVQNAEQFIDLAASSSSTTGEPYLVMCGAGAPVQSATWLRAELQTIRSPAKKTRAQ